MSFFRRLASYEDDINFRKAFRISLAVSGVLVIVSLAALGIRNLNLGIDFRGGTVWEISNTELTSDQAEAAVVGLTEDGVVVVQTVGNGGLRVETGPRTQAERVAITDALLEASGQTTEDLSVSTIGPSWGEEVSRKALRALLFFFIAVAGYISIRLEWRMAVAAIVAVLHDIIISVGVYAITGLVVTPATVVAFLTILGFSLYDTIVVFDKIDDNAKHLSAHGRYTFTDIANLSLNQTMMRSINTTITAMIPVISILVIGVGVMGAESLAEFGWALLVGLFVGAYSSIFVAAPVLIFLKEREPRYVAIRKRLESRGEVNARTQTGSVMTVAEGDPVADTSEGASKPASAVRPSKSVPGLYSANHPPRPRKQGKKR